MLPRKSDKKYLYTLLSNGKYFFLNCRVLNNYRTAMKRLTFSEKWLITLYGPHSMNLNLIKVHLDFVSVCLRCSHVWSSLKYQTKLTKPIFDLKSAHCTYLKNDGWTNIEFSGRFYTVKNKPTKRPSKNIENWFKNL